MKQLELKKELDLDKPEDVNWLMEWSKQAWQRIQELEAEQSSRLEKLVSQKTVDELQQDIIDLLKRIQEIAEDTIWMNEAGTETIAERLMKMFMQLGGDENKIKFMYDSRFTG